MEENQIIQKPENQLQRLYSIFVSPGKTIASVEAKPNFLLPIVVIVAVSALTAFLTKDLAAILVDMTYANAGMTPEQIATIKETSSGFMSAMLYIGIFAAPLSALFKGMISHFISLMIGGEGKFAASVSMVVNAYMIQMLGTVLALPIILITKNAAFSYSPAVFLPMSKYGTPVFTTASALSVFTIWYLYVSVLGFKKLHKYSTAKALIAVILPFVILLAFGWLGVLTGGAPSGL